jgi:hypothetical protein
MKIINEYSKKAAGTLRALGHSKRIEIIRKGEQSAQV